MPYPRPTLTTLRTRVLQAINAAQITDQQGNVLVSLLQKAVLRVLATATAGMSYEHYGYLDWIALQAVPWTATNEFLDGWANLKGVFREDATATQGTVTFSDSGAEDVPEGWNVVRGDGAIFVATATATPSGGSVTVVVQAAVAGSDGNFDANTAFTLQDPISGILAASTASAQTVPGTDTELDESLRTRMLAAYAAPPQGGDRQDYIEWALAVPGVTRAWVAPNAGGAGSVTVYVMLDEAEAAFNGFPQGSNGVAANETRAAAATGDQLTVANAIFDEQPVTALVYVNAPAAQPVNFSVGDLGAYNTTEMQAAIAQALAGMFLQYANVGGSVVPETGAAWPAIPPSAWYAALQAIPGLPQFEVTMPAAPISPNAGSLFTVGTITYSS